MIFRLQFGIQDQDSSLLFLNPYWSINILTILSQLVFLAWKDRVVGQNIQKALVEECCDPLGILRIIAVNVIGMILHFTTKLSGEC